MNDLEKLRNKIDKIDEEIIALFVERLHCAVEIAEYKKANSLPIVAPERERDVIRNARRLAGEDQDAAEKLMRTIIELSCEKQKEV